MRRAICILCLCLLAGVRAGHAQDGRQLVKLPEHMQQHMLANMRDHLATLDEIVGDLAKDDYEAAAKVAESRLGMSSLTAHDAAHLAPFMPQPMQDLGTSMHHAASRLVIALQNASLARTPEGMREVHAALHEVTAACTACHAGYRIR
jgi:cytochrome c556